MLPAAAALLPSSPTYRQQRRAAQVGSVVATAGHLACSPARARLSARSLHRALPPSLSRALDAPGKRLQNRRDGKGLREREKEWAEKRPLSLSVLSTHIKQHVLNSVNDDCAAAIAAAAVARCRFAEGGLTDFQRTTRVRRDSGKKGRKVEVHRPNPE